jgi:yecA family protein
MTAALFTYEEVDLILRGDGCGDYVGISAIDGLIAAVVAGPAYLEPDDWLPEIFAGRVPASPRGTPNHRLVQTILHRHDEVAETLARRPNAYLPIFMHDDGRVVIEDWTVGFMLGVGKRANAWSKIILSDFRSTLAPILSGNPLGRYFMLDVPVAELDRFEATAHQAIHSVVAALYRHCASDRSASRRLAKLRAHRPHQRA